MSLTVFEHSVNKKKKRIFVLTFDFYKYFFTWLVIFFLSLTYFFLQKATNVFCILFWKHNCKSILFSKYFFHLTGKNVFFIIDIFFRNKSHKCISYFFFCFTEEQHKVITKKEKNPIFYLFTIKCVQRLISIFIF